MRPLISVMRLEIAGLLLLAMNSFSAPPAPTPEESAKPVYDSARGIWHCLLPSPHQEKPARLEILLPSKLDEDIRYPVLYILPVGRPGGDFGDALDEAKKANLADKHGIICVTPYFAAVPWYGNHVTDPKLRQEDHLLYSVLPFMEKHYPVRTDAKGRWLLGFSKSGWGACTLLFRHPDIFGYAAAWDVPFMLNGDNSGKDWGPMGLEKIFGTKETMQQSLPTRLAAENATRIGNEKRLVIGVGKFWKAPCEQYHAFLTEHGIAHSYRADLLLAHRWDSGWLGPMAEELVRLARESGGD